MPWPSSDATLAASARYASPAAQPRQARSMLAKRVRLVARSCGDDCHCYYCVAVQFGRRVAAAMAINCNGTDDRAPMRKRARPLTGWLLRATTSGLLCLVALRRCAIAAWYALRLATDTNPCVARTRLGPTPPQQHGLLTYCLNACRISSKWPPQPSEAAEAAATVTIAHVTTVRLPRLTHSPLSPPRRVCFRACQRPDASSIRINVPRSLTNVHSPLVYLLQPPPYNRFSLFYRHESSINNYLCRGSFAVVKRATLRKDGSQWAIKCIDKAKLDKEDAEALQVRRYTCTATPLARLRA